MGHALMPKDLLLARKDDDGNTQTLYDHLHNTAKLAAGFEKRSSVTAFAAGLLHDSGKATASEGKSFMPSKARSLLMIVLPIFHHQQPA